MLLLESGVSSDSSTLRLNQTALHISAFAGNSHCLKWLLHCGASINRQVIIVMHFQGDEYNILNFSVGLFKKAHDGDQDRRQL